MRYSLFLIILLCGCGSAPRGVAPVTAPVAGGPDPTVTDPDNYKTVLENEHVRVLRYHDIPGAKTHLHHHPASVLYALSTFRRRLTFGDGHTQERELHEGEVVWLPAQDHMGENIGTTPTEVLLVEVKATR